MVQALLLINTCVCTVVSEKKKMDDAMCVAWNVLLVLSTWTYDGCESKQWRISKLGRINELMKAWCLLAAIRVVVCSIVGIVVKAVGNAVVVEVYSYLW